MTKLILSKTPKEDLQKIVDESHSFKQIIERFNLANASGNYRTLRQALRVNQINLSKFLENKKLYKSEKQIKRIVSDENLFSENSSYYRETVKQRILQKKLIPYSCSKCKMEDVWCGEKIVLVLDHINGINNDNRLENLRFLCPNCNSQTDTFTGRNNKKTPKLCPECKSPICKGRRIKKCRQCYISSLEYKISAETLEELIKTHKSYISIAKTLGNVTPNTIKKYMLKYNLTFPKSPLDFLNKVRYSV